MTRRLPRYTALCAAALALAPLSAQAQDLIDANQLDDILAIAQSYGEAELEVDNTGDPMISGKIEKTNYAVFFYGCTDGKDCSSLQFVSSYIDTGGLEASVINEWNKTMRFGKAYLDDDSEPVIELNVNLWSGVHHNNLNDTFDWWRVVLEGFEEHIDFEHAEETEEPATEATEAPATDQTPEVREAQTEATDGQPSSVVGMGASSVSGGSKLKLNQ